jgi:hypothetical protein
VNCARQKNLLDTSNFKKGKNHHGRAADFETKTKRSKTQKTTKYEKQLGETATKGQTNIVKKAKRHGTDG